MQSTELSAPLESRVPVPSVIASKSMTVPRDHYVCRKRKHQARNQTSVRMAQIALRKHSRLSDAVTCVVFINPLAQEMDI